MKSFSYCIMQITLLAYVGQAPEINYFNSVTEFQDGFMFPLIETSA